eukprot:Skav228794  [mRNA]  locus=scaffold589:727415:732508:- [translate_table: standard]
MAGRSCLHCGAAVICLCSKPPAGPGCCGGCGLGPPAATMPEPALAARVEEEDEAVGDAVLDACVASGLPTSRSHWRERKGGRESPAQGAVVVAGLAAAATMPEPALAARVEEEDEGFDLRILAVLALPLFAVSWALFNVWRVAFRQVVRIGESEKGNPL